MATSKSSVETDIANIQDDLKELKADLAGLVSSLVGSGKDQADVLRSRAKQRLDEASDQVHEFKDYAQRRSQESVDQVEQCIQERPLTSVLVCFLAGFIFGKLINRD